MMSLGAEKVLLLYNPSTYDISDIVSTYVYRRGLVYAEYSFSTAVDILNSAFNIMLLIMSNSIARRMGDSSLW